MGSKWIAVAGATLLISSLASPASALPMQSGSVRNLVVKKLGKRCVRVTWDAPAVDSGEPYGVIIRSGRGDDMFRVRTYRTHTRLCSMHRGTYHVQVKQAGGFWARGAVRFGK